MKDKTTKHEFEKWLRATHPEWRWTWAYQRYIYEHLHRVTMGRCRRLMIFMPPRHGKSELVTVRYTAWRLLREPGLNVILGSYNQKLADKFSRKIKSSPPCLGGVDAASADGVVARKNPDSSELPPRQSQQKTPGLPPLLNKEGAF